MNLKNDQKRAFESVFSDLKSTFSRFTPVFTLLNFDNYVYSQDKPMNANQLQIQDAALPETRPYSILNKMILDRVNDSAIKGKPLFKNELRSFFESPEPLPESLNKSLQLQWSDQLSCLKGLLLKNCEKGEILPASLKRRKALKRPKKDGKRKI